ncbi:MAG: glycosyltransferase family 39 protein [Flavobacteriales bacterium]|nr:glycosyltransferase family 39 protein [Flavobacteriales bacterium]
MSFTIKPKFVLVAIVLLGIALHWNIWERDIMGIHAWRQTQTMTVVENFATEDMNILDPRINSRGDGDGIFRMEFPLMQWLFAWFYKWFGSELVIARILTFLISLFSICGFYWLLRQYRQSKLISAIGAWCYAWSPVLFYYSVNPLPDNLALCFTIWSVAFLKRYQADSAIPSLVLFALFLSLATAVKLPFILFGAGYIPIFIEQFKSGKIKSSIGQSLILGFILLPASAWYLWVIPQWTNTALIGGASAEHSFDYQSALNTIWGTAHSLVPELFLNYGSVLFLLFGIGVFFWKKKKVRSFKVELSMLFFISLYYLYEVNMIGLVHDYYLFPFLPLLFLVATAGVKRVLNHPANWLQYVGISALVMLPLTAYLRAEGRWTPMGNETGLLTHKEELRNLIPDDALVVVGNDPSTHIFLYHIHKKGWTFEQDWLTSEQLKNHIDKGAKFLYSNTDFVEQNDGIGQLLGEPIFDKDGIRVYPLIKSNRF